MISSLLILENQLSPFLIINEITMSLQPHLSHLLIGLNPALISKMYAKGNQACFIVSLQASQMF
jgi:hypothetical protein